VREEFMPWLEQHHPDLVERYEALYPRSYASPEERRRMGRQVSRIVESTGRRPPERSSDETRPAHRGITRPTAPAATQDKLF
jgi:hypothetical protein